MPASFPRSLMLVVGALIATSASATSISYSEASLGGGTWQYDFSLTNDTLGVPIGLFELDFDYSTFSNLVEVSAPAEFADASNPGNVVVQPFIGDPAFPVYMDGYFDFASDDPGLAPGATATGFIVDVAYSGSGTPGGPQFQVFDANYDTIDSGDTTAAGATSVPEPNGLALLGIGLLGLHWARRRSQRI